MTENKIGHNPENSSSSDETRLSDSLIQIWVFGFQELAPGTPGAPQTTSSNHTVWIPGCSAHDYIPVGLSNDAIWGEDITKWKPIFGHSPGSGNWWLLHKDAAHNQRSYMYSSSNINRESWSGKGSFPSLLVKEITSRHLRWSHKLISLLQYFGEVFSR